MLASWHFHVEICSKCALKCPRCARAEVPLGLVNTELNLEFFKKNFTPEIILSNVEKITFCGNDGDPIYSHDLIEVIKYLKAIKQVEIVIVTNGSHKKVTWWKELASTLTEKDTVHFSIDGYDNVSNNLYRAGSDFDSIIRGIQELRIHSRCQLIWAAIAFKFNENYISDMKSMACTLQMDKFQLTKSTKFGVIYPSYGENDPLQPSDKFISKSHRFEREIFFLSDRFKEDRIPMKNLDLYEQMKNNDNIIPLCGIGNKGLYISSQGKLFPCCWVANRYGHNSDWQTISEKFNLNNISLAEALKDSFWFTEFQSFKWQECKTKCNKSIVDKEYATSW